MISETELTNISSEYEVPLSLTFEHDIQNITPTFNKLFEGVTNPSQKELRRTLENGTKLAQVYSGIFTHSGLPYIVGVMLRVDVWEEGEYVRFKSINPPYILYVSFIEKTDKLIRTYNETHDHKIPYFIEMPMNNTLELKDLIPKVNDMVDQIISTLKTIGV